MRKVLLMADSIDNALRLVFFVTTLTICTSIVHSQAPDQPDISLEPPKDTVIAGSMDSTSIITMPRPGETLTAEGKTSGNNLGKYHFSLGIGFYQSIRYDISNGDYYFPA
ncbi:MAG: hypothetical protein Q8O74_09620, partial [bacterium]|nr:hypothetical protein [bacterium]